MLKHHTACIRGVGGEYGHDQGKTGHRREDKPGGGMGKDGPLFQYESYVSRACLPISHTKRSRRLSRKVSERKKKKQQH